MKENYFRIAELPTHQILIEKDFDNENEEDPFLVTVTFHNKGVKVKNSYGYSNEYLRDTMFEKITDEQLQKSLKDTLKLFS